MANSSSRKITEVCFVLEPSPIEHLEDSRYQNWLHRESSLSADTPVTSAKKQGFEYWTTAAAAFPDVGVLAKYFDQLIEPAVDGNGFRIVRSSQISTSHFVTRQHLQLARDAELMIANLSAADPVVYYCVAYRLRCREDLNNDHGTIFVRHTSCKPLLDNLKVQTVPFGLSKEIVSTPPLPVSIDDLERESDRVVNEARRALTDCVSNYFAVARASEAPAEPHAHRPSAEPSVSASRPQPMDEEEQKRLAREFARQLRSELSKDLTSVMREVARRYYG